MHLITRDDNDRLQGGSGNDNITGGDGVDNMKGNGGDEFYAVDLLRDVIDGGAHLNSD